MNMKKIGLYGGVAAITGCIMLAMGSGCENKGSSAPGVPPWAKTYGGSFTESAYSIQQTTDRGYIAAGDTLSFGAGIGDFWVLKLKSDGSVDWQKAYGGANLETASSIQQTTDGGYIVAGSTYSFGAGDEDAWVLKLKSDGSVDWQKAYGGISEDYIKSIRQTTDGGYIAAGSIASFWAGNSDIWVLKLNADGSVAWQKTYGGANFEWANSIQQTTDGGYIVACGTTSFGAGKEDFWVLKLNSDGSAAWQKTYGGPEDEGASFIQQTTDGGYIVAGTTYSFGAGNADGWVLKLNADGSVAGQKAYGGANYDSIISIQQTTDGGDIAAGYTSSFGAGLSDIWVLKLNADGGVAWQKAYGGASNDYGSSIQQTTDGGYIAAGSASSFGAGYFDMWITKLPVDGSIAFVPASGAKVTDATATVTTSVVVGQTTGVTPSTTTVSGSDTPVSVTDTNAFIYQLAP